MRPTYYFVLSFLIFLVFTGIQHVQAQKIAVDSIIFQGNDRTKYSILRRELDLFEKDTVDLKDLPARMEFNRRKLMNTNLFIWVKSDFILQPNGKLHIRYEFLERWYILAYPIFQLADRNFNDWLSRGKDLRRASYGLNFRHSNFMGRNEKLFFNATSGFNNRFDFTYQNPYVDRKKTIGILVNLQFTELKNVAYNTISDTLAFVNSSKTLAKKWSTNIIFSKRLRFYDFQRIEFKHTRANVDERVAFLNPDYFGQGQIKQSFSQIGYSFSYDFRDLINYPLIGRKLDIGITKFGLLKRENVDFWEASASAAYFFHLGNQFYFATNAKAKISRDTYIPYTNLRGLGYENDLVRGYELNVIDGTGYFLWRNTLKFQLFSKVFHIPYIPYKQINQMPVAIYPTVFLDFGYVHNANSNASPNANKLLVGTGMGFDFIVYNRFVARLGFPIINGDRTGMVVALGREF
jgi:outer membrane protein assembly factor BamA